MDPLLLRGLLAAILGAVAMTLSSTTEMYLRERPASDTPGKAGNQLLGLFGVPPRTGPQLALLATWVHWIYSTIWGVVFWALMDPELVGFDLGLALPVFFGLLWVVALFGLPLLGLTPPFWRWGSKEILIDGWHHATYVEGTGVGWVLIGLAA